MLCNLRPGSPVFVIFRNGPRVVTAKVAQLSSQYPPQFSLPIQPGAQNFGPLFDLSLELDGKTELFQRIPVNTAVAEFPDKGIIISETREGVTNEINAIYTMAMNELEKRPMYEQAVANCKQILLDLNPEAKREQAQAAEIAALKKQISGMSDQLAKFSNIDDRLSRITDLLTKSQGAKSQE